MYIVLDPKEPTLVSMELMLEPISTLATGGGIVSREFAEILAETSPRCFACRFDTTFDHRLAARRSERRNKGDRRDRRRNGP